MEMSYDVGFWRRLRAYGKSIAAVLTRSDRSARAWRPRRTLGAKPKVTGPAKLAAVS
jgi:hypothetical protein